ncbi:MAG: hypothetical protein JSU91_04745 [Thermoplasmatales archaeon]|nr:MAG: hypothetical protein JSU91_04745 [Thermoplasmatales archaeon]
MKSRIICKPLAVAVIVLFLGLAVQPSVAVQQDTTDSEDDCDICPTGSIVYKLVKEEDKQKLSDIINTLLDIKDKDSNSWEFPILTAICNRIGKFWWNAFDLIGHLSDFLYQFPFEIRYICFVIIIIIFTPILFPFTPFMAICFGWPYYWPYWMI